MAWEIYLAYLAVVAAFFATPPDTSQLLVMSNAMSHGLKRSLFTIAGDLTANVLQMLAAAFGLTVILASSADALTIVKWAGVAYLSWIGVTLFLAPARKTGVGAAAYKPPMALFRQGFLTSGANPYAVVFFASLFPQFIDPASPIWPQLLILGATYLVVDGVILILWGIAAVRASAVVLRAGGRLVNRICGCLMIAAAALLGSKEFHVPEPEGTR